MPHFAVTITRYQRVYEKCTFEVEADDANAAREEAQRLYEEGYIDGSDFERTGRGEHADKVLYEAEQFIPSDGPGGPGSIQAHETFSDIRED